VIFGTRRSEEGETSLLKGHQGSDAGRGRFTTRVETKKKIQPWRRNRRKESSVKREMGNTSRQLCVCAQSGQFPSSHSDAISFLAPPFHHLRLLLPISNVIKTPLGRGRSQEEAE